LGLALAAVTLAPAPALAAGVGFSLPKFRYMTVTDATGTAGSVGGSVQVVGGNFSIGPAALTTGLDYGFTRNFGAGANYSFFDVDLGLGVPLAVTDAVYEQPAIDGHMLLWVASPESLTSPSFGVAPRLTFGYKPRTNISVELGVSQMLLVGLNSAKGPRQGGMSIVELSGTYSF
jgi:hypothetical protein